MKTWLTHGLLSLAAMIILSGCIATGTPLNYAQINQIQRGVTTEQQIRAMFGEPDSVEISQKAGIKKLIYGYSNSDQIKKTAAGAGGAIAGSLLGSQIGNGNGSLLASSIGAIAGGLLADNAVTARGESQVLTVLISLRTGKVVDYNYKEYRQRTQPWHISSGVGAL